MRHRLPPYVQAFKDRQGTLRYYFRREGFARIPLPGLPWSPAFMAAHADAMEGGGVDRATAGMDRATPGTMNALAMAYLNSGGFKALAPMTRSTYRNAIEALIAKHGDKRVKMLETKHVMAMIDAKAATPSAANHLLRMLRILMGFAVGRGWRKTDPTAGVKQLKEREGGFVAWSETDIATFEAKHPVGTRARLALALLLYTAQRRGDVIRMGRQHVRDEILSIRQQKTGTTVDVPVLPELRMVLDGTPSAHLTFITTESGRPFTSAGFGNWFREICDEAGLPKRLAAHGLRKAASRRLAEAGCTAHEIMAITGHRTLREVTRYTESVDRRAMARSATEKLRTATSIVKPKNEV